MRLIVKQPTSERQGIAEAKRRTDPRSKISANGRTRRAPVSLLHQQASTGKVHEQPGAQPLIYRPF